LVAIQPNASADVTMKLGSTFYSPAFGPDYPSPYSISINNGPQVWAFSCDDFLRTISPGLTWNADVYTLDQVTPTGPQKFRPATAKVDYEAAGLLAWAIMANPQSNGNWAETVNSYAIWSIFYSGAENSLTTEQKTAVDAARAAAYAGNLHALVAGSSITSHTLDGTGAEFYALTGNSLLIYTPDPLTASQEFLSLTSGDVHVPESSSVAFLAFDLSIVLGGALLAWKRLRRNATN